MFELLPTSAGRAAFYAADVKPRAVMLIGNNRCEATLATAALYCAGARIVSSAPDLAVVIEAKAAARQPRRHNVPLIAIVPPGEKRKALAAGVDAAYVRPAKWKAYSRLMERVLAEWAPTRRGSAPRRGRTS
jgi:hypothetical protein